MTDVILERGFDRPLEPQRVRSLSEAALPCFDLHRIRWEESLLARDGRRLVCHFRAPDVESARIGLRQAGADVSSLWAGRVYDAPALRPAALAAASVMVERHFAAPVTFEAIQALEDAGAACLNNHQVRFLRTFFSLDRQRMLCLYHAPDAESVRLAQHQAGMPVTRIWAFRRIAPEVDSTPAA
ncbi:DUF4242 domain-containing protein [Halomonas sp. MCCC 1A17488]|uniref:DUF4242 domain-containing protein n=1 Tax=Billgrantia sulfidoxydans TaxID=2733484 RepID=A0ABX7W320_9GAMM|nr:MULTISPECIES: DUF4242 domain-containing protein [Halomonas]MCE8015476.1 DUF4242 domain-containing protein [Halomonas sp. MCCC 1A17488]MCG3238809.1 DUF4242 domain-containing protein [Halomonas sp. MCCC 1A17488]QPP51229.1 DUF4242 domain-containing protein [Halomonas sp. SS10-MC5]QTP54786.1 DUF4242 domain-containing protein [Halomonas sulfidoxydans]